MNFYIVTDHGDIDVVAQKSEQNCWLLSVTGVLESWILPDYDEDNESNCVGPCELWEAIVWVAVNAEARGATVLQIGKQ